MKLGNSFVNEGQVKDNDNKYYISGVAIPDHKEIAILWNTNKDILSSVFASLDEFEKAVNDPADPTKISILINSDNSKFELFLNQDEISAPLNISKRIEEKTTRSLSFNRIFSTLRKRTWELWYEEQGKFLKKPDTTLEMLSRQAYEYQQYGWRGDLELLKEDTAKSKILDFIEDLELDSERYEDFEVNDLIAAVNKGIELADSVKIYSDDNKDYIELSDNHTLWNVEADIEQEEYCAFVNGAMSRFESFEKTEPFCLGRSGRHICVENNYYNAENYNELCERQSELEKEMVSVINLYEKIKEGEILVKFDSYRNQTVFNFSLVQASDGVDIGNIIYYSDSNSLCVQTDDVIYDYFPHEVEELYVRRTETAFQRDDPLFAGIDLHNFQIVSATSRQEIMEDIKNNNIWFDIACSVSDLKTRYAKETKNNQSQEMER